MRVCTRPSFSLASCAHRRKCCVQKRRFYLYIFVYVLRAKYYARRANLRTARQSIFCALRAKFTYGVRAREVFMVACLHNFALGRLTKIYILSATGYLLQPCCQLEMQPTLSLCLWSGTRYTIDYCHALSSQITQNSLFISNYYMLTSVLSVSCPNTL